MTKERPGYLDSHDEAVEEIGHVASLLAMAIEGGQLDPSLRKLATRRGSVRRALASNQAGDEVSEEC